MKLISFVVLTMLLVLAACTQDNGFYTKYQDLMDSSKPLAHGANNKILLFKAIPALDNVTELDSSLVRETVLVFPEQYFQLEKPESAKLEALSKSRNLVLCGTLDSPDPVSSFMRNSLSDDLIGKVKTSGAALLVDTNVFSRDQIILYLLATNVENLTNLMRERADQAFAYLLEHYQKRLAYQAYLTKVLEPKAFQNHPFSLQIPQTYSVFKEDVKGSFLSLIYQPRLPDRKVPDKYVSVYYEPMPENKIDAAWVLQKRQELGGRYFDGDEIPADGYKAEEITIAGFKGWRLYGSWLNHQLYSGVGGAFQTFAFWHEPSKTAYLVDNLVYFPDGDKLPPLLELGMISQSLVIK